MPLRYETTFTTASTGPWIPLDQYEQPFNVAWGISVVTATSAPHDLFVEHTFVDVLKGKVPSGPDIFIHDMGSTAKSADGNYAFPVAAVRFRAAATGTAGSVTFRLLQAGT